MRLGFYSNQLCLRGTSVALFDYALAAREHLGVSPTIVTQAQGLHHQGVFQKFEETFGRDRIVLASGTRVPWGLHRCEEMYAIKYGHDDGLDFEVPQLVHAVFPTGTPHGDRYAYVSQWASEATGGKVPYVPHIVRPLSLIDGLREELGIPQSAMVFGRHGGDDTFDIGWAQQAIIQALEQRDDVWFLFMHTRRFTEHPRVIHIDPTPLTQDKGRFIKACDAMVHARVRGETFGLACAEFAVCGRPVLTWRDSEEKAHIHQLKQSAIEYVDQEDLLFHLLNMRPRHCWGYDADELTKTFAPERVMARFREVFLK